MSTTNQAIRPFDAILYGAAYYHEYMPSERLEKDIALMVAAGINFVRLGESTWSLWEPSDGAFETEWLDRVVDAMHAAGIRTVIGTPTYSLPTWLAHKYPEILARRSDGRQPAYGMRQNMNTSHAAYRFHAQRIIRRMVEHYRDHPGVIGWQIDNETASYGASNDDVFIGFVDDLKARYGTLDNLNKAWLTTYWSQNIHAWEHLTRQDFAQSTGYRLDWTRYQQSRVTDFLAWQAAIVREYRRPDQFIMHDFSPGLHKDIDEKSVSDVLDYAGVNPYHGTQAYFDGHSQALNGDYYRSLKNQNYFVTEINAQAIGWNSAHQYPPYDGQARLDVFTHIASGAAMVSYWHWATLHSGIETYWKGVLGHDLEPNRFYAEVAVTGRDLRRLAPEIVNLKKRNEVALLYSVDSDNALDIMPITETGHSPDKLPWEKSKSDYHGVVYDLHRALFDQNIETDILDVRTTDWSGYKLLVIPALYIASDDQLRRIAAFVKAGGHVLTTFKTGFADENAFVRPMRAPGPLRDACGFSYQEFSTLDAPLGFTGDLFAGLPDARALHWAEFLQLEGAQPLAHYDHPFFGRWPAVTEHDHGAGRLTYQGCYLDPTAEAALVARVAEAAGVARHPDLPASVRVRRAQNAAGRTLLFVFNYASAEVRFANRFGAGEDLLSKSNLAAGAEITIKPWDLMILATS